MDLQPPKHCAAMSCEKLTSAAPTQQCRCCFNLDPEAAVLASSERKEDLRITVNSKEGICSVHVTASEINSADRDGCIICNTLLKILVFFRAELYVEFGPMPLIALRLSLAQGNPEISFSDWNRRQVYVQLYTGMLQMLLFIHQLLTLCRF